MRSTASVATGDWCAFIRSKKFRLMWALSRALDKAHARRKFHDIHVTHRSPITTEALNRIGALYAIEDQVRGKPPDIRRSVRQDQAKPILDDFRRWMEKISFY